VAASTYTAFAGDELIAAGDLTTTVLGVKSRLDEGETRTVLVFEDQTGSQIDFDWRGSPGDVLENLARHPLFRPPAAEEERSAPDRRGPGRPRLGVVCREVSLLPRHWQWLEHQKGGASAALRRLVDEARKRGEGAERARLAWEAAGRFMWAMAGNLAGFEEASRALYARNVDRLAAITGGWPRDVRAQVERLAAEAARLDYEAGTSSSEAQTAQ
jgi:hypothetical protein